MYDIMHGSISPVDMIGNAHHDIFKKNREAACNVCLCVYVMCSLMGVCGRMEVEVVL